MPRVHPRLRRLGARPRRRLSHANVLRGNRGYRTPRGASDFGYGSRAVTG
jgi:hypothetical protein